MQTNTVRRVPIAAALLVIGVGLGACGGPGTGPTGDVKARVPAAVAAGTTPSAPSYPHPPPGGVGATDPTFTLSAVGDTIMAAAPAHLPSANGTRFFADVAAALHSDLQMANLEEPLTDVTSSTKCGADQGRTCFAFRAPSSYASILRTAGFDLVNIANNHALDFGPAGHAQTESALTSAGLRYTGPPGVITVVTVKGVRVAVLGFAPYPWANDLRKVAAAQALVRRAGQAADVVIVQAHMGGEGAAYQHVRPGDEIFLGEDRGDPIAFSHAMIDAGADLVIGHSPHVLRAMEFYRGHLIAYSLGNFAGYHALSTAYPMGVSMILRVTLRADGTLVDARIVPTSMVAPGVPEMDPSRRAISLVRSLTGADFPTTGARIAPDGAVTPPA